MIEEDVQWVFITKLELTDGSFVVTDERGTSYIVDLKQQARKPNNAHIGEGVSVEILYRSPASRSYWFETEPIHSGRPGWTSGGSSGSLHVWFARETVQWVAILTIAPFAVVWLLWQVVGPSFRAWADRNVATPKKGYRAERAAKAYAHRGYQKTLMALAYAALLLAAAATGLIKLGLYNDDHTSMYINTTPGPPAATALLVIPALGLLIASIGATAAGPYYGAAVAEAGFLPVIWCFSGAVGVGFAGFFSGVAGGAVVAVWETLAGLLLIAGLRLRSVSGHAGYEQIV
jgi:hypothetical protein